MTQFKLENVPPICSTIYFASTNVTGDATEKYRAPYHKTIKKRKHKRVKNTFIHLKIT